MRYIRYKWREWNWRLALDETNLKDKPGWVPSKNFKNIRTVLRLKKAYHSLKLDEYDQEGRKCTYHIFKWCEFPGYSKPRRHI